MVRIGTGGGYGLLALGIAHDRREPRCDLNTKTAQEYHAFLCSKGGLAISRECGRTTPVPTEGAAEYVALFFRLFRVLFDAAPGFKL
jgi:hypothetical protein